MEAMPALYAVKRPEPRMPAPERVRAVVADVAKAHGFTVGELLSHDRPQPLAAARFAAFAAVRALTMPAGSPPSLHQMGRWFGRDHSTVHNGLRRHAERVGAGA
jgi:chromosomal replication initiation ATPase DnaA